MTKSSAISLSDQPSLMRASRLHGIRDLRLDKLSQPVPGPGEVLLQVASVGVCGSTFRRLDGSAWTDQSYVA